MEIYWDSRKDFIGLSTEEKPNNNIDGDTFYEVDTGKFYIMYKNQWYEQIIN